MGDLILGPSLPYCGDGRGVSWRALNFFPHDAERRPSLGRLYSFPTGNKNVHKLIEMKMLIN